MRVVYKTSHKNLLVLLQFKLYSVLQRAILLAYSGNNLHNYKKKRIIFFFAFFHHDASRLVGKKTYVKPVLFSAILTFILDRL